MVPFRQTQLFPRWRPPESPTAAKDPNSEAEKQRQSERDWVKEKIYKALPLYLIIWFFCILTVVSSPDILLLVSSSQVELPLIGYQLSFVSFLIFSPFILMIVLGQLFLMLERRDQISIGSDPFDSNMLSVDNLVARVFSSFVLYYSLPIYLMLLSWKAWVIQPVGLYALAVTVVVIIASFALGLRRTAFDRRAAAVFVYVVAAFVLFAIGIGAAHARRGLGLAYAALAETNLSGIDLSDSDLAKADLNGANLANARFGNASLSGANFANADLTNAIFSDPRDNKVRTNIEGGHFRGATLSGANFFNTNLRCAIFAGTDLSGVNFYQADLTGADFSGADLSRIMLSEGTDLSRACGDPATKLPPGVERLPSCSATDVTCR